VSYSASASSSVTVQIMDVTVQLLSTFSFGLDTLQFTAPKSLSLSYPSAGSVL